MPENPIDGYLDRFSEEGKIAAQKRDQEDLEVWQTWKKKPTKQNMSVLLDRMKPVLDASVRKYKAPNVNEAAFRGQAYQRAIQGFTTYDPNKGASLRTHTNNFMRQMQRYNAKYQNVGYIPEDKLRYIGPIDAAKDAYMDEHGRYPSHREIVSLVNKNPTLRLTVKRVAEVEKLRRKDILGSSFESDPLGHTGSRDREVIALLRPSLKNDEEREVFDYLYGMNGKPRITSTNELAQKLNKNSSQIARIKSSIIKTYNHYL